MKDPVGTVGGARGGNESDFDLGAAASGGPRFIDRLEQLATAREAHDRALAELRLGRTAHQAIEHASQLHSEARNAHAKATKALSEANESSTRTLREAAETAKRIIDKAKEEAAGILAISQHQAVDAKAEADQVLADAKALRQEATRKRAVAQSAVDENDRIRVTLDRVRDEHAEDKARVEQERERLTIIRDGLYMAVQEAGRALGE